MKVNLQKQVYLTFANKVLKIHRWDRTYIQIIPVYREKDVKIGTENLDNSPGVLAKIVQDGNKIKLKKSKRENIVVYNIQPWMILAIFKRYRDYVSSDIIMYEKVSFFQIYVPRKAKLKVDGIAVGY